MITTKDNDFRHWRDENQNRFFNKDQIQKLFTLRGPKTMISNFRNVKKKKQFIVTKIKTDSFYND